MLEDKDAAIRKIGNEPVIAAKQNIPRFPAPARPSSLGYRAAPARVAADTSSTDTINKPGMGAKQVASRPPVPIHPSSSEASSINMSDKRSIGVKQKVVSFPVPTPISSPATSLENTPSASLSDEIARKPKAAERPVTPSVPIWTPPEVPSIDITNRSTVSSAPTWIPPSEPPSTISYRPKASPGKSYSPSRREAEKMLAIQERCRQLCLPLFYQEQISVRSLGFTSASAGEGKTFLAAVTAEVLASDLGCPVTLLECNWEHPCLHEQFGLPATPGLAEWVRGECNATAIRHRVSQFLTIIPAGNGKVGALKLLHKMLEKRLLSTLGHPNELLVVDLPPIANIAYGSLAAHLVESLVIVVRAQATSSALVAETCEQLKGLPLHGIALNQVRSRIPYWLQQIL